MNKYSTATELFRLIDGHVIAYKTDHQVDSCIIGEHSDRTPFLHIARQYGTHILMLPTAQKYSLSDRTEKSVRESCHAVSFVSVALGKALQPYEGHKPHIFTYFDGECFRNLSGKDEALHIFDKYVSELINSWRIMESL